MFLWRRVAPQSQEDGVKPTATPGYSRNFRRLNQLMAEGKSFSGYERNPLFLNRGGQGFTDVSGALGVDFDDDARAVAQADWDGDGRQDLWITNRSAPRLRLLRNRHPGTEGNALAVRLRGNGQSTNADAVGARATLISSDPNEPPQSRTVRAGDGFLAQSSLWLHFGLGQANVASRWTLQVDWPGGARETFKDLEGGWRYELTQGGSNTTSERTQMGARWNESGPNEFDRVEDSVEDGFWVARRVPFPEVRYQVGEGGGVSSSLGLKGQPVLVNLWATWCSPCLEELQLWTQHAEQLRGLGATVLALNVDGLAVEGEGSPRIGKASRVLESLGFDFPHGVISEEGLGKIEVLIEFLSSRRLPLTIPSSFLLDADGRVAAVYLQPVSWERLSGDLALLNATPEAKLKRLTPRSGRWLADPRDVEASSYFGDYATRFASSGFPAEAQRLTALFAPAKGTRSAQDFYNEAKAAAQQGESAQAMAAYQEAIRLKPDYGQAYTGLGALLLMQKRSDEARVQFEKAMSIDPNHATALINLAMIDQQAGDFEGALSRLQRVVARNPEYGAAHLNLGSLLANMKRYPEAIQHLTKALSLNPEQPAARFNLAAAYTETEQWAQAEEQYRLLIQQNPRAPQVHYGFGRLQARQGKHEQAAVAFRQAILLGAKNAPVLTLYGRSLAALGKTEEATAAFRAALQLDPNHAGARQALSAIEAGGGQE